MNDPEGEDNKLDSLVSLDYHERITQFIRGSTRHLSQGITVLDSRPLYSVAIHHIQRQLAKEIRDISNSHVTDDQLEVICQLIEKNSTPQPFMSCFQRESFPLTLSSNSAKSLRDFEYIHANRWHTDLVKDIAASRIDNGPGSKFQAALLREFELALNNQSHILYCDEDLLNTFNGHLKPLAPTRGTKRRLWLAALEKRERASLALRRLMFAILGGLAIVIPFLLMASTTAPRKTLIIVGLSIVVFALVMAIFSSSAPENLLAATAAYAAVLVVFVKN